MKKKIIKFVLVLLGSFYGLFSKSQSPTIGLLYTEDNISESYLLFAPSQNKSVFLINNLGEKINKWDFSELPGATCYLLENGNLLRAGYDFLEIRDWNSNLIWSYGMNINNLQQHHDIEPLPNGNILCIISDKYTETEIISQGRDPMITDLDFRMDKIIELQPVGTNSANIVWEWKFANHLIQDFDYTKLNYGNVGLHPELIDINYNNTYYSDWIHLNAIDYNSDLDQIMISSRHLSEIYIIDHSTTTIQASGHTGGNSNMGGDLLWRWGNPQVYRQGEIIDQKLHKQHDAKWIEKGYADEGKISVFNNGGNGSYTFSSIHLILPELNNGLYLKDSNKFLPHEYFWSWNGKILDHTIFEDRKGGVQGLKNGNFIICQSSLGQATEINKAGDYIWVYKNPVGEFIYNQYDNIEFPENSIFRAEKYPYDYIGFLGQDLTPSGVIETENSTITIKKEDPRLLTISNPVSNGIIYFNNSIKAEKIKIIDLQGKIVFENIFLDGTSLKTNIKKGYYIVQIITGSLISYQKIIVI